MKLFKALSLIALSVVVIAAFIFWRGSFSKSNVKIEVIGPTDTVAGQESEFIVRFKNNSNVRFDQPRLTVEFPLHTVVSNELPRVIVKDAEEIGYIYPGEEKTYKFEARLFGSEGDVREVQAMLTFQPKGLSARYSAKTQSSTIIKSVPISFEFDSQSKIESGKTIKMSLKYFSNLDYQLSNLGIEVDYPENFNFDKSEPAGDSANNWRVDGLAKGEGGKIQIYGVLTGDIGQEKTFKARLGFWHDGEFVVIKKTEFNIGLQEPSIEIDQTVNGSQKYAASLGEVLHYDIKFRNIGKEPYQNLFLAVRLKGDLYDLGALESAFGEMETSSGTIVWDGKQISELKILAPGEEGNVQFRIKIKSDIPQDMSNPTLGNKVVVGPNQKEFITRINSRIEALQRVVANDDLFLSEGPLPLRLGQGSQLTVFWDIKNYFNDVENVKVKAVLPANIEYLGEALPESEQDKLIYDPQTREILWKVGDVSARTGFGNQNKFVSFPIKITPNPEQKDRFAEILLDTKIYAYDKWTEQDIENKIGNLDTSRLPEDKGRIQQ
ncbi:MAG TPA: hypothetical protein PKM84_00715 [Candidatus Pacearchaeota archaeon]|nr:hypothetical protein [Candidatus Pacearchaeota archaeon]